jgi:hypothetical protein
MYGMNGKSTKISGPRPLPSTFFSLLHSAIRRFIVWTNEEVEADYSGGQSSPWAVAPRGGKVGRYQVFTYKYSDFATESYWRNFILIIISLFQHHTINLSASQVMWIIAICFIRGITCLAAAAFMQHFSYYCISTARDRYATNHNSALFLTFKVPRKVLIHCFKIYKSTKLWAPVAEMRTILCRATSSRLHKSTFLSLLASRGHSQPHIDTTATCNH